MLQRLLAFTAWVLVAVGLVSCSEESHHYCSQPLTIEAFCGAAQSLDDCDCISEPIDLVAYVDLTNLPQTKLVTAPSHYGDGSEMIGLVCNSGGGVVPETAYPPLGPLYPIRAELSGARIVKIMQPANGGMMPTWHLEIETADQVRYYHVIDDTTEVLIVQDDRQFTLNAKPNNALKLTDRPCHVAGRPSAAPRTPAA